MKTQSTLVRIKQSEYEYIYIYFKYKNKLIRINTGNKVVESCMTKELLYNSKMKDKFELNQKTLDLKSRVDEYILYRINNGWRQLSKEECIEYVESGSATMLSFLLKKGRNEIKVTASKTINDYFEDFYNFKKAELNNRVSSKDYLSLFNALKDYQKSNKMGLTFDKMNSMDFMVNFRNFLSTKRGEGFLTKGGLQDNTINKRITALKTFFSWCEIKEYFIFKKNIHVFKAPKYDNNIVVLSKDEIRQLAELDLKNESWIKIIDIFVCNCFMGLRFSDLETLKKSDFVLDELGEYTLIKENKKTNFYVEIPIKNTSLRILKKYDFELPKMTNQYFNRELKKILEHYNLFSEIVTKKRRVVKSVDDFEVMKRTLISCHTCRRTYITLCFSKGVPLNTVMLASGHTKIQTMQKYMKKVQDRTSFDNIDLETV